MKSKKNQANVLAKECMVSALMQLLEDKPLSAISVTELTEKAGVSRMTYYRNYQSKEEWPPGRPGGIIMITGIWCIVSGILRNIRILSGA